MTATRDEVGSVGSLLACLERQTVPPARWVIVDTGSRDGTLEVARAVSLSREWVRVQTRDGRAVRRRGAVVAEAVEAGFSLVDADVEVVVKVDADVTFGPGYFESLLREFEADPSLGIASGVRYEPARGGWRRRYSTGPGVESQCRAYRVRCLPDVLPFERAMGWDGVDLARASLRGWRVGLVPGLAFRHHRGVGARERSRLSARWQEGVAAHHMGYRPSYVCLRAAFRALRDPAALALVPGFASARVRGRPRCSDDEVVRHVRREQALRNLRLRAAEALGLRARAGVNRGRTDLLLVADAGGHLFELAALREAWLPFRRVWVTTAGPDAADLLPGEQLVHAHGPTRRSVAKLVRNTFLAVRLVARLRPRAVVSTGSALAVPFAWVARLFGCRVVFVECSGRIGLSLSCRLLAPAASRIYVQWPELAGAVGRARYAGSVFFSDR